MTSRVLVYGLAILLLSALIWTGCTPAGDVEETSMSATMAIASEPNTLDPQTASASVETSMLPLLYDTLVYRTPDNTYQPFLAESWEIDEDGTAITFTLRNDVTFHDGSPLTADAVIYTFKRFEEVGSARSPLSAELRVVSTMEKVSDQVVRFTFRQPAATFFSAISQPYAAILSQSAVDAAGDAFGQHPVGTGPFVLSEWKAGQSLTLTPNPDYAWGPADVENKGTPYIDELVMRIIPDSAARDAALIAGEIDITYVDLPDEIRELDAHDAITITDLDTSAIYYLAFNMQRPPLDQLPVRQALSHLVNKDELVTLAFDGIARSAYTLLPPDLPGNSPDLQQYELTHDPDRARQMLLDAGMTAGADGMLQWAGAPLKLTLVTSARSVNTAMITVLESQFRTGGVALDIQQMEVAAATEAANAGEHDLFLWRYTWNDPDALHMWFGADRIGNGNRAFYSNAEVDSLFARGQTEMDQAKRETLYVAAQKQILQDAAWQPLVVPIGKVAVRDSIQDLRVVALGRLLFNDVVITR